MNEESLKHGAFSWMELRTTDIDGAKRFYASLFGWQTQDMSMTDMQYTVISVHGDEVAGMMQIPKERSEMPPHWGLFVTVDNVDATADRAAKLGGQVLHQPTDIPDVGRFAIIQDPQGAVLGVITYRR